MTLSSACSAPISATKKQAEFLCIVNGASHLPASMNSISVCDMFKDRIDLVLPKPTAVVKSLSSSVDSEWFKVDVRISKQNSAGAVLTRKSGALQTVHPEIVIDVMDKALGKQELARLADEVAKLVSEKVED
jgi:hypothetical protein